MATGMRHSVLVARGFDNILRIGIVVVGFLAATLAILPLFF